GVRFKAFSVPLRPLTRPHFRHSERAWSKLSTELFQQAAKSPPQIGARSCGDAHNNDRSDDRSGAVAIERSRHLAQNPQSCIKTGSEIDERSNSLPVGEQCLSVQRREHLV